MTFQDIRHCMALEARVRSTGCVVCLAPDPWLVDRSSLRRPCLSLVDSRNLSKHCPHLVDRHGTWDLWKTGTWGNTILTLWTDVELRLVDNRNLRKHCPHLVDRRGTWDMWTTRTWGNTVLTLQTDVELETCGQQELEETLSSITVASGFSLHWLLYWFSGWNQLLIAGVAQLPEPVAGCRRCPTPADSTEPFPVLRATWLDLRPVTQDFHDYFRQTSIF